MSVMRALIWKEWRSIRTETLVLGIVAAGSPLAWRVLAAVMGSDAWTQGTLIATIPFLLPAIALILGATTTAGDGAMSFAASRAASRGVSTLARIGVRLTAVAIIAALTLLVGIVTWPLGMDGWIAKLQEWGDVDSLTLMLAAFMLGCFAAGCLLSAHVQRPLAAIFGGGAVVGGLWALAAWALGGDAMEPRTAGPVMMVAAVLLFALALRATLRRSGDARMSPRSLVMLALALGGVAAVGLLAWTAIGSAGVAIITGRVERELAANANVQTLLRSQPAAVTKPNQAHLAAMAAADALGFDVRRGSWRTAAANAPPRAQEIWERAEVANVSSRVTVPPDEVAAWMQAHEALLLSFRDAVGSGEPPRWLGRTREYWDPTASAYLQLGKVLNARALMALAPGGSGEAEALRDLEAEWRIAGSLAGASDITSALFAISTASRVLVTLRKVGSVPESWDARLDSAPWRDGLTRGLLSESQGSIRHARQAWKRSPWEMSWSPARLWLLDPMSRIDTAR